MITPRAKPELILNIPLDTSSDINPADLLNSLTIQKCHSESWKLIAKLYNKQKFKSALHLLLSQTEALLRFVYGQINELDVAAYLDKYYIVLDSIFYEYILDTDMTPLVIGKLNKMHELQLRKTNRRNKMMEIFPPSLMHLGYDLFRAENGPRLRDKISHGEASCNENCKLIFRNILHFVSHVVQFYDHGKMPEFSYESIYMTNYELINSYNAACVILETTFENLNIPDALRVRDHQYSVCVERIDSKCVKTFFRPLTENLIVKLLLQVVETCCEALQNFSNTCEEFFRLYKERKLRSTRRQTLAEAIEFFPNFLNAFQIIFNFVCKVFADIQQIDEDAENDHALVKFLKQALQFAENLAKHFSSNSRNFFVANEKTCKFVELTVKCKYVYTKEGK